MPRRDVAKWVGDAVAIDGQTAWDDGKATFMGRVLVQTTLPHSARGLGGRIDYQRTNGNLMLSVTGTRQYGLPYGSYPRLVLAWLTTEAVQTRSRYLVLGESLSAWMRQLGLLPTGGRWGTIGRLRQQMAALFTSTIRVDYADRKGGAGLGMLVASRYQLWWDSPQDVDQAAMWQSTVTLSPDFFEEIIRGPVPLHVDALRHLRGSAMQLDLYCWLTHRMSYLKEPALVPWDALALQFGGEYKRIRKFREELLRHLPPVLWVYREALVAAQAGGLLLRPSPPHVPPRRGRGGPSSPRRRCQLPAPRTEGAPGTRSEVTTREQSGAMPVETTGSPPRPPWCGQCMETTRRREHPETGADLGRCPDCHPEPIATR